MDPTCRVTHHHQPFALIPEFFLHPPHNQLHIFSARWECRPMRDKSIVRYHHNCAQRLREEMPNVRMHKPTRWDRHGLLATHEPAAVQEDENGRPVEICRRCWI